MKGKIFIDSNIWLYALIEEQNSGDEFKHLLAKKLFLESDNIQISTQVVNEISINLMRKAKKDNNYIFKFIHDLVSTSNSQFESKSRTNNFYDEGIGISNPSIIVSSK